MVTSSFPKALLFVLVFSLALSLVLAGCLSGGKTAAPQQQSGVVNPSVQATGIATQSGSEELPPAPPGSAQPEPSILPYSGEDNGDQPPSLPSG